MAEALALVLLAGTLAFATTRPRGLPELVVAVPAALLVVASGVVSLDSAWAETRSLAPTVGFLAAVLVLGELCDREGLFAAAEHWIASTSRGRPVVLLALVFVVASAVTAVLSLDTTVVLLTPVVFATAARSQLRAKPHVYACVHLANSASLLLPVSNLSNLLAFHASHLSFLRFGALMALPWLTAIAIEWLVFRRFFGSDLVGRGQAVSEPRVKGGARYAALVVTLTLIGFALSSLVHLDPAVVAAAGAVCLAVPALAARRTTARELVRAAAIPFLAFVLALGIVVKAAAVHGLGSLADRLVPSGQSLLALLAVAALAALLANLVNNLPAILILLPAVAHEGSGAVLAALIGVNLGPNLTYVGSLATLLWRRILRHHEAEPDLGEFLRLGALTVPPALLFVTAALWLSLRIAG